jgi:hypothetical protein
MDTSSPRSLKQRYALRFALAQIIRLGQRFGGARNVPHLTAGSIDRVGCAASTLLEHDPDTLNRDHAPACCLVAQFTGVDSVSVATITLFRIAL